MEKVKILIIEDEKQIARFLELELQHDGYETQIQNDGPAGVSAATVFGPDLILLDVMLPGFDGIEVCRRVREFSPVPIIMLTAKSETADKVQGLDCGANDYVTKPFALEELTARVRTALRTGSQLEKNIKLLVVGALTMDLTKHKVVCAGNPVELTKREFDLLEYLMRNRGIVLSRDSIIDNVWGIDYMGDANVVDVYVKYLRDKIEADSENRLIHTVRGFGYVLEERSGET
jgi:Response regulators consisting of a CheY-like receiver domain and a winged-helix DNA-binding domain